MVQHYPAPNHRSLLPPLLACLPTAFASPRPPPALLPLLSPILRQRVQLLATTSSSADSWLPLLCWETEPAARLVDIIANSDAFELHPVSGEIDFGDVEDLMYRRLDEETLQARIVLTDLDILVIYIWCEGDEEGGGNGWRVSELKPLEGDSDTSTNNWLPSIAQADDKHLSKMMEDALQQGEDHSINQGSSNGVPAVERQKYEDDDYWAQYDNTPGRTPAAKSPGFSPTINSTLDFNGRERSTSEEDYYARYAQVQPEMDNDDPSEDRRAFGDSTLKGNSVTPSVYQQTPPTSNTHRAVNGSSSSAPDDRTNQPTASSRHTRSSTVPKLEECAESQCMTESAVAHHISTSIKSMYRLARSSGIEPAEFDRMICTELDTLGMMNGGE